MKNLLYRLKRMIRYWSQKNNSSNFLLFNFIISGGYTFEILFDDQQFKMINDDDHRIKFTSSKMKIFFHLLNQKKIWIETCVIVIMFCLRQFFFLDFY